MIKIMSVIDTERKFDPGEIKVVMIIITPIMHRIYFDKEKKEIFEPMNWQKCSLWKQMW